MQASDSSLGPYLRSEREQQGIDLKDIASSTKIQPKFIEALEDDNYDQLPKGPFVIGFIRSYAQCLSLDPDEVVAFFQAKHGAPMQHQPVQEPSSKPRLSPIPPALLQRRSALIAGLVAIGCVLLVVLWNGSQRAGQDRPTAAANRQPTTQPSTPEPSTLPTLQETTAPNAVAPPALSGPATSTSSSGTNPIATDASQGEAPTSDTPDNAVSEASIPEPPPLVLRVQALEKTWMRLEIDNETPQEALVEAGQTIEWQAKTQFSLTLGNVRGARVSLNDQALDLPATRSNVLRDYVLTRALLNPRRTD